jgi:hypothetical protein
MEKKWRIVIGKYPNNKSCVNALTEYFVRNAIHRHRAYSESKHLITFVFETKEQATKLLRETRDDIKLNEPDANMQYHASAHIVYGNATAIMGKNEDFT